MKKKKKPVGLPCYWVLNEEFEEEQGKKKKKKEGKKWTSYSPSLPGKALTEDLLYPSEMCGR